MTNLEKIQSMDDIELASFITTTGFSCMDCSESEHKGGCDCECSKHCLEWLNKEASI